MVYREIGTNGWTLGVIDHNFFEAPSGIWNGVKFEEGNWNGETLGAGDQSWASPTGFGTIKRINVRRKQRISQLYNPEPSVLRAMTARAVDATLWRYNIEVNINIQTHPTGGGQRHRGCRTVEIYNNADTGTGGSNEPISISSGFSSGGALVWGNTIDNTFANFVTIHSMRRSSSTYTQTATPNGWGYCGTSFDGTGSAWDRNSNPSTGYRCLDQPGQGVGQLFVNDFPNAIKQRTGTIAWPHQALEPVYEWLDNSSRPKNYWRQNPDSCTCEL